MIFLCDSPPNALLRDPTYIGPQQVLRQHAKESVAQLETYPEGVSDGDVVLEPLIDIRPNRPSMSTSSGDVVSADEMEDLWRRLEIEHGYKDDGCPCKLSIRVNRW